MIAIVMAASSNNVIGKKNGLPWVLKDDLHHFRKITINHTVIMGRKTYESIGKPLKKRRNIVVSQTLRKQKGVEIAGSLADAIQMASGDYEVYLIGGKRIINEGLKYAEKIYLTRIHKDIEGDTAIDPINYDEWHVESERKLKVPEFDYSFITLTRKNTPTSPNP